jgi:hypothetical protein
MTNDSKIKNGFYNTFYSFKLFEINDLNKKYSYVNILEKIIDSGILITDENENKEIYFRNKFINILKERKNSYRTSLKDGSVLPFPLSKGIKKVREKTTIDLSASDSGISITVDDDLVDNLEESQVFFLNQLVSVLSDEEQYTGIPSKEYKNRFLLFPPMVTNTQDLTFHPGINLTIFKHGYAVLWISMELENVNFELINSNKWDLPLKSTYLPEFMFGNIESNAFKKKARCNRIQTILEEYSNYLYDIVNNKPREDAGNLFHQLVLSDYSYRLKNFDKTSNLFNEHIYKLLYAPINNYQLKSHDEINSIINEKYYSFSRNMRLYANHNRAIYVYSEEYLKTLKETFTKDTNSLLPSNESELNYLNQKVTIGGMINAIETILLKKESQNILLFELNDKTSLRKLTTLLIKENINYSVEFSKYFYTYGSVRELLLFLEKNCEDFLQTNLMIERKERIEKVISLRKEQYISNFTALGPVITIVLTMFFSFPTLENIFEKIQKEELFLPSYIILNLIMIVLFSYLTRNEIIDIYIDIKSNLKLKLKLLNLFTYFYLRYVKFAIFMNLDYKAAFKIIYNKIIKDF